MAKPFDIDAAIEQAFTNRKKELIELKFASLKAKRTELEERNKWTKREDRELLPNLDLEMGKYEAELDREHGLMLPAAKRLCKSFIRDASDHDFALDHELLTSQTVEAMLLAPPIYFSIILKRSRGAAS